MDVLSDTLRVVRLSGAVFLNARLTAPWAVATASPSELASYLGLSSDCVAIFHILVQGQCWFSLPDHAPVLAREGDAILLPHNPPHVVSSDHGVPPVPMVSVMPPLPPGGYVVLGDDRLGETSQFLCGFLHCDQRFNPLLSALPDLMVVHPDGAQVERATPGAIANHVGAAPITLNIQPQEWLATTIRHTVEESRDERPGAMDMLARLSELLFVEIVRRYMQQLPEGRPGWLAGVRDPVVGQTLGLLHAHPEYAWTVEELAQAVAVSRSSLADRFTALIGEAPMRYLAAWRMHLAQSLLKQTSLSLGEVAARVGYDSDVAFNRAFKRHVGQPPATWRAAALEAQN
ncbi:MAG TPA: AraC family transcriptional regulator [Ktedonobacterales bacterium]|nr:AraC family transcriptional regulator [Ktedonobacterales bacterium]